MKVAQNSLRFIWRCWFYVCIFTVTLLGFPLLLLTTLSYRFYPFFFKVAKYWAKIILFAMGFRVSTFGNLNLEEDKSYMFCPNHASMVDVMILFSKIKNPFVFVGKKELAKIPIFGFFYKRTSILVDRSNNESRLEVFNEASKRIKRGLSICIFPEGGVPKDRNIILGDFKSGAFRLAIEHQIPVVPIVLYDCKKRFSYDFFSGCPGVLRMKILDKIPTKNLEFKNKNVLRNKVYDEIRDELLSGKD